MLDGLKARREALMQDYQLQSGFIKDFEKADRVDYALTIQTGLAFWKRLEIAARLRIYDGHFVDSENFDILQNVLTRHAEEQGRIIAGIQGGGDYAQFVASAEAQECFYILSMIDAHIKAIKAAEAVLDDDAPGDADSGE